MLDLCLPPRGLFRLEVFRRGRLIERVEEPNLIVTGAKSVLASLLGGTTVNMPVNTFGVGTNGSAPVPGNTMLTGAFTKAVDGVTFPLPGQVSFQFSLLTTQANGLAIQEFGLLNGAGTLIARKVRGAPLNKDNTISFTGSWIIQF
jgi:hypothetical protein